MNALPSTPVARDARPARGRLAASRLARQRLGIARMPRHVGFIPDGNRRWADARGLPRREGYAAGLPPALVLLRACLELGIEEVSVYGFTKENVRRPPDQVVAFREACVEFAFEAMAQGAALRVVGDARSRAFPERLRPYAAARSRGAMRVNFLVNYGWQWDLAAGLRAGASTPARSLAGRIASADCTRVDLVVRWGGRRRLSGFLPVQCAYADFFVHDALWPDMRVEQFIDALRWYDMQDITLGG